MQLFVAILIMAILNPWVSFLSKYKIPRPLSILVIYVVVIGLFAFAVASVVPPLVEQTTSLTISLPLYIERLGLSRVITDQITDQIFSQVASLPGQIFRIGYSVVTNILSVLFVLFFAFYLLLARNKLDEQLAVFLGEEQEAKIKSVIDLLETRLGGWARGELALMFLVGLANYIGLSLLGVPFAISLAIIAGILEIVPYIGPILAGALATVIGVSISPVTGLAVVAMAFLIQQVENYVFVPKIMEKSVGVNPLIIILGLTIGFRLFGFIGILLSVPAVIILQVSVKEYLLQKTEN